MFSILDANAHIPPHHGPYKGVLRYHLGLIVPVEDERCAVRVDNEVRSWKEGKSLIFDDSFEHEVWNRDPRRRVVLFVDFPRPLPPVLSVINQGILAMARHHKDAKRIEQSASRYAQS
ncbi:aspartyl/asparaginyl beta-hydroxylase domain-containing protein [Gloeobacter violaceus]|nr:aspartyl/asparaginyl beta-hydroxylase domain-containing protein [Gloeobacter violaceus]